MTSESHSMYTGPPQNETDWQEKMNAVRQLIAEIGHPDGEPVTVGHYVANYEQIELEQGEQNNG